MEIKYNLDFLRSFSLPRQEITEETIIQDNKYVHERLNLIERPETYFTLLGEKESHNFNLCNLRKRLNRCIKEDTILFEEINNIRGRLRLFFCEFKKYYIILTSTDCYYCYDLQEIQFNDSNKLYLVKPFRLRDFEWEAINHDVSLDYTEVLKCF